MKRIYGRETMCESGSKLPKTVSGDSWHTRVHDLTSTYTSITKNILFFEK